MASHTNTEPFLPKQSPILFPKLRNSFLFFILVALKFLEENIASPQNITQTALFPSFRRGPMGCCVGSERTEQTVETLGNNRMHTTQNKYNHSQDANTPCRAAVDEAGLQNKGKGPNLDRGGNNSKEAVPTTKGTATMSAVQQPDAVFAEPHQHHPPLTPYSPANDDDAWAPQEMGALSSSNSKKSPTDSSPKRRELSPREPSSLTLRGLVP